MQKSLSILLTFLFMHSFQLHAEDDWGATGHRTVGEIASHYLTSKTKRKIRKLLNKQSLGLVSTHADEIKSDKRYDKFSTWHYINMPMEADYDVSKQHPEGDLVSAIAFCKSVILDKNASDDDKAFYLKLLIHFIGDLHQPLHVALEEDRGGNDFKLQWFYNDTNLHSVWDSKMIDDYGMGYLELANNEDYLTKDDIQELQKGTVIDWVNDTHKLTRDVYANVKPGDNLRYEYSYKYMNVARKQIQIAGVRLAKILNELF
ncbi:S1/P1 nuclease [Confluentibacter flavum]|uniref:S1/P1 Nuclease n=1 Tax=Confluentibacter flavum TaxID=1909700 RepID=A0A2N3HMX6_9FLAO|nr:S1/P1 nuclease [Confluentibacter flavum]PKQ46301.1 S1/P1 Nuclease [Confluentibacter flavum]